MIVEINIKSNDGKLIHTQVLEVRNDFEVKFPADGAIMVNPIALFTGYKFEPYTHYLEEL